MAQSGPSGSEEPAIATADMRCAAVDHMVH